MMYTECDISTCPCQEQCLNQRFHKHEWVSGLEVIVTKDRGYGIRTSDSISNGKYPTSTLKSLISQKENSIMLNKQNRESYCSCSEMSLNKYSHFAQGRYCYNKKNFFQVEREFYHIAINLFMGNIYCKEPVSESILYIVKGKIVKFSHSRSVY